MAEPPAESHRHATSGSDALGRRILQERTRQLATRVRTTEAVTTALLLLETDGESCALRVDAVALVAALPQVAPVPRGGPALLGVADIRGVLCCVHDLAELCGRPAKTGRRTDGHLVVLRRGGGRVGLRVDRAIGIVVAPTVDLAPAEGGLPGTLGRITRSGINLLEPETILGRVDGTANHVA